MSIAFQTGFQQSEPPALFIPQGWQCPACRIIHAPYVQSCACQSHAPDWTSPYCYPYTTCPDPIFTTTYWPNEPPTGQA